MRTEGPSAMLFFTALLISLLALCPLRPVIGQGPITCTAGHYRRGQTASITCHFHGGLSKDRQTGVLITRFDLDGPQDASGKEALVCHFDGGGVSVCDPADGFKFVSFPPSNLTIQVPDVAEQFQGRYSCGTVPPTGRVSLPCLLVVEGGEAERKDSGENEQLLQRVNSTHSLVIAIFVVIIIALIVLLVVVLVITRRKNLFPFRKKSQPKETDNQDGHQTLLLTKTEPIVGFRPHPNDPFPQHITTESIPHQEPFLSGNNTGPASTAPERESLLPQLSISGQARNTGHEVLDAGSRATDKDDEESEEKDKQDEKCEEPRKETKKEKADREKEEKKEKADREKREKKEMEKLKKSLEDELKIAAPKEKKTQMKKEYNEAQKTAKKATSHEGKLNILKDLEEKWKEAN